MSRNQRLTLVAIAALIAVVAFVALRPSDDPTTASNARPAAERESAAPAADDSTRSATDRPERRRKPKPPLLVAGSERTLRYTKGETVRFRVRHPTPEEVHVHGYDVAEDLPAGRTVTVQFPAELEGIFEVELEGSHTPLGSIRVDP
ncbi:MAG: hypothetical protein AVDCRST_MAG69-565 [uncultured Solirubrobacteraceae bacterium]|uniref:EfeO-type cupredoxin-like domain-containing protein n=1 Tax=uncultured Solirubrobacteraceae bacterium TaxID=1162706 RepID=A0A6J4RND5_9ACTN|nr:MAG: hypothetical protein AVDCRST_MAG69-565 [uncultured Solirubrobacteraceae bacterium]